QEKKTATIDEELGLVDNFVYIMKVRFGNRLDFEKEIPVQTFKEEIPVMTLQPLVENCIKHGLKNKKVKVILSIQTEEKYIVISISDNGSGIPDQIKENVLLAVENETTKLPEQILNQNNVLEDQRQHTGTGLINVFLRLKLYFHRNDIFDITSGENGEGTKFIIRIPKHV
ncbi:MAG: two-component sensor histidine kinase, partial [Treponema sp.]|nr:two-component sensor histidine kinase [Treponema sp.]